MTLILCFGISTHAFGQANRSISTKDGLPQSFVSGLEQDQAGFVWVGTRNGLARYDGVTFKVFSHRNSDSSSLSSNLISNIKGFYKDIWIEHESGEIDQLDPVSERIRRYAGPLQIHTKHFMRRAWIADVNGVIWRIVDGEGLIRYGTKPKIYNRQNSGLASDTLSGLCEGKDGLLWVLTRYGLSSLDRKSGIAKNYASPRPPDYHDYHNAVRFPVGLHQRSNGELMWADRKFIYFFSLATKKFIRLIPFQDLSGRGVTWIRTGPDGSEYFERSSALYRYNEDTGLTLVYGRTLANQDPIQSFLVDRSGLVWFGTNAHGIFQVDLTTPFFPSFPIKDGFAGDVLKAEFNASLASLFDWQPKDQRFAAPGYHIRSAYDKQGVLWIGLKEQVVHYDVPTKAFTRLPKLTQISNSKEPGIGIKGLTISPEGMPVVIGYNRNVLIYNTTTKRWDWLVPEGEITRQLGKDITPQDLWMDDKRIWITTETDGLLFIDRSTGKINQLQRNLEKGALPTNQLLGIKPDPSRPNLLWIGSYNGLLCLNKTTLKVEVFNTASGLPDNTIYSLLSDSYGNLWFGTNKGLCSFSPITHKVRTFRTRHGLLEDEYNRFHQLKLPDGRLAFGGTEGWTLFDPTQIKDDRYQPAVALTNLKLNNEEVISSPKGVLPTPLNALDRLVLPYDQSTVTISFAGLQFNQPQDLQYRYQLSGYDNDWIIAGHIPFANYTKLPPGSYEFMVNASNTTGQWSKEVKKLPIIIHPPWWQTWWAYGVYFLLIGGSIWYWVRQQSIRMDLRRSVEQKQREAQQLRVLTEMKERFFTNVTHDFRTPLTLILSPLVGLIKSHTGTTDEKKLISIQKNAEQLLTLINQLLDFSKLDAQLVSVDESAGDVTDFAETLLDLFKEDALKREIQLMFSSSVSGSFWFDASKLDRMLSNLISNAMKFTPAGGTIHLSVSSKEAYLVFSVSDTGIGIAPDKLPHIFNRYYQIDRPMTDQTEKGSGIGLTLVKELAALQKGYVEVESTENQGSVFRIGIPYQPVASKVSLLALKGEKVPIISSEQIRILIVEDHTELSDFIADNLPEPYIIERASNGAEGLKLAIQTIPDLIISDVMMPIMDGFELCQQLKQHENTNHIPVILLTAKVAVESRMEGLMKGADDYLAKPFYVQELNLRVSNLLERERKLRARIQAEMSAPSLNLIVEQIQAVDPFLEKFYKVIDQHLDDSSIGVEELADLMNMSRSQLHRKVRAIAGMAISEVVRNYRLARGAEFLKAGFNSSESAYKAGFDSPAYFSKCFREFYGVVPSEFLKRTI